MAQKDSLLIESWEKDQRDKILALLRSSDPSPRMLWWALTLSGFVHVRGDLYAI
jgi:hypothetical protein